MYNTRSKKYAGLLSVIQLFAYQLLVAISSVEYMVNIINIFYAIILGDPEVTANIYCKSSNLPNTDTQNYSTDLR